MKRAQFRELAQIINYAKKEMSPVAFEQLTANLCYFCAKQNPAFNETQFREAVYAEGNIGLSHADLSDRSDLSENSK